MSTFTVGNGKTYNTVAEAFAAIFAINGGTLNASHIVEIWPPGASYGTVDGSNFGTYTGTAATLTTSDKAWNSIDATGTAFTITVQPGAGQGFKDNITPGTSPVRVDKTKGITFESSNHDFVWWLYLKGSPNHCFIIKGLQFVVTQTDGLGVAGVCDFQDCILEHSAATGSPLFQWRNNSYHQNTVFTLKQVALNGSAITQYSGTGGPIGLKNCTILNLGTKPGGSTGVGYLDGVIPINGCIISGFDTNVHSSNNSGNYNVSDTSSGNPPGAQSVIETLATTIKNTTYATYDAGIKTGSGAINLFARDSGILTDVQGGNRSDPTAAGAAEYYVSTGTLMRQGLSGGIQQLTGGIDG